MVYLDTSVLLPYYRPEAISDAVQAFLGALAEPVSISWLTEIEVSSALARWVRMGECTEEEAAAVEALFDEDLEAQLYRRLPLASQHFLQARRWLRRRTTGLRVLDALHLAVAQRSGSELVTADRVLVSAAKQLDVKCRLLFADIGPEG